MNVTIAIPSRTVFHFLNARAVYDPARTTLLVELYDEYKDWCLDHQWEPTSVKWFGRYVREHARNRGTPIEMGVIAPRRICYLGIALGPHPRDVAKTVG